MLQKLELHDVEFQAFGFCPMPLEGFYFVWLSFLLSFRKN